MIRRTYAVALTALLVVAPSLTALAEEIAAKSAVSGATIYPSGATVTRTAVFEAPAGGHEIVLRDMPMRFNVDSLRVTGQGDAPFQVLSVDHSVERVPVEDPTSPQREEIEAEIVALEDEMRVIEREKGPYIDQRSAARARLEFIEALARREPQRLVDMAASGGNPDNWRSAIEVIGEESRAALALLREADVALTDIDLRLEEKEEQMERLRRRMANNAPAPRVSTLRVRVAGETAVNGELAISYRIEEAAWAPIYDVRLDQQEGGGEAALRLERRASVTQTTGEDWEGVDLVLSTARPSQRMAAPRLNSRQASIAIPMARPMPASPGRIGNRASGAGGGFRSNMLMAQDAMTESAEEERAGYDEGEAPQPEPVVATQSASFASLRGQTLVYEIPDAADVEGDGSAKQLFVGAHDTEAAMVARSAPARDATAYLYASYENDSGGPVLAGAASVFRDGAYVGQVSLPFIPNGETKAIPFGSLDSVIVERRVLERSESQEAGVAPHRKRVERIQLSARSTLGYPLTFTFFEATPYSETDKVEIMTTADPEPTEKDVEGDRGVWAWTFELPAGETQTVEISHEIHWPIGATLNLR